MWFAPTNVDYCGWLSQQYSWKFGQFYAILYIDLFYEIVFLHDGFWLYRNISTKQNWKINVTPRILFKRYCSNVHTQKKMKTYTGLSKWNLSRKRQQKTRGKFNFDQLLLGFFPIWGRCGVPFHISCLIGDWFFLFKNPVVQHKTN